MLIEDLPDEGQVHIGDGSPQTSPAVKAVGFNGVTHRIGMDLQLAGDGADFPVLGKEPVPDLSASFFTNHEFSAPINAGRWEEIDETTRTTTYDATQ
jgi:hypothetical protein